MRELVGSKNAIGQIGLSVEKAPKSDLYLYLYPSSRHKGGGHRSTALLFLKPRRECSLPLPDRFTLGKETLYALRAGGRPQERSGRVWKIPETPEFKP